MRMAFDFKEELAVREIPRLQRLSVHKIAGVAVEVLRARIRHEWIGLDPIHELRNGM
jgi:hypothetical protein